MKELYDYPLSKDSIVLDIGAYEGNWGLEIYRRYGSRIWMFEPCEDFFHAICKRLGNLFPSIRVTNAAVTAVCGTKELQIKGDMTGFFVQGNSQQFCELIGFRHVLSMIGTPDLVKINAEGSEFLILGSFVDYLEFGEAKMNLPKYFQVQFHRFVPDFQVLYNEIQKRMAPYYDVTFFDEPSLWQGYKLK